MCRYTRSHRDGNAAYIPTTVGIPDTLSGTAQLIRAEANNSIFEDCTLKTKQRNDDRE